MGEERTDVLKRTCTRCGTQLPEQSRDDRRYCSRQCKNAQTKSRQRLKQRSENPSEIERLEQVEHSFYELQHQHRKVTSRLAARDRKIRRLEHALKRSEHQVETVAEEQAQETHDVGVKLAAVNSELGDLKRHRNTQANVTIDHEVVTTLRADLNAAITDYTTLRKRYETLFVAAESAAQERKDLQGVVRQWNTLCKRLYRATGGRPRRDSDKKILSTWLRLRKLVRE